MTDKQTWFNNGVAMSRIDHRDNTLRLFTTHNDDKINIQLRFKSFIMTRPLSEDEMIGIIHILSSQLISKRIKEKEKEKELA